MPAIVPSTMKLARRLADPVEQVAERSRSSAMLDRLERRAEQADVVPLEDARLGQRDGEVQAGLAAERRQQAVRPLALAMIRSTTSTVSGSM